MLPVRGVCIVGACEADLVGQNWEVDLGLGGLGALLFAVLGPPRPVRQVDGAVGSVSCELRSVAQFGWKRSLVEKKCKNT